MARKQNYSFQRRERDASKVAKRVAKLAAREDKKKADPDSDVETAPASDGTESRDVERAPR